MLKVKSNQHGVTFFLKICLNLNFQQLFQDTAYTFLKTNYAAMFPVTVGFQNPATLFLALKICN